MSGSPEPGTPQPDSGVAAAAPLAEVAEPPGNGPSAMPEALAAVPPDPLPTKVEGAPVSLKADRDVELARAGRVVVLGSLLLGAFGFWTQLAFRSPWLDSFLLDNEIEPERRSQILAVIVGSLALGGVAGFGGL